VKLVRLSVLATGALRIVAAQPSDTGRYTCQPQQQQQQQQQQHHVVVVVFTPTVSVDYRFVFRVPMCDENRMTQKVNYRLDLQPVLITYRILDVCVGI